MRFKKIFLLVCLLVCLFAMASVCASDANDTVMASENSLEINQTTDDVIGVEEDAGLASPEENDVLTADELSFTRLNETINDNNDNEIYLDSNYMYYSGEDSFKKGIIINRDVTIYGNGHTINGNKEARIFQVTGGNVVFYNITFINGNAGNNVGDDGGAINGNCKAINCTFYGNSANYGGAMVGGGALNCTFSNNHADNGGAMYRGDAVNCTFIENTAWGGVGGAMVVGSAVNCTFSNNYADVGGAMFEVEAVNCTFSNNYAFAAGAMFEGEAVNCIFSNDSNEGGGAVDGVFVDSCIFKSDKYSSSTTIFPPLFTVLNFTSNYNSGERLMFNLTSNHGMPISNGNITIEIYKNKILVGTYYCLSGEGWMVNLPVGLYDVVYKTEYALSSPVTGTIKINKGPVNIEVYCSDVTYPNNVVVTVKSDVNGTYIVKIGEKIQTVNLVAGEAKNVIFTGVAANEKGYAIIVSHDSENYTGFNDTQTVKVKKANAKIAAQELTATYNTNKYLVIRLKDNNGNPIRNVDAKITINGVTYKCRSNGRGDARLIIRLKPKTYTAKITFDNSNYAHLTQYVKVTVLKATPKLTAKKKTFKATKKVKKYTVTLKDKTGKAIKKAKVTLKIGKKTYKVKTNSKGKAVFKIKNLNKKGKYKAVIKYNGNYLYKMVTKKVKLVIK